MVKNGMTDNKRIDEVDIAKGIGILLVVLGHTIYSVGYYACFAFGIVFIIFRKVHN